MARNGRFGRLAKSAGFRRNPQQHAGTGAIRQEKTPTENGWGFVIGGAGGNRTRVHKPYTPGPTYVAVSIVLAARYPTGRESAQPARWRFASHTPDPCASLADERYP